MRKFRAFAGKTLSAAAILAAALSASPASAKPDQLTVYGGPLNTSWYIMAGWLATELQKDGVKANSELGGALSNLIQIGRMPENMGFTFAAAAQMAYDGVKPFPGRVDKFCAIQLLQRSFFTAMVTVASGIESAAGLVGKTYSGQAVGNLSQVALSDFFKASGVNEKDIDIAVGGQQFGADGVKDRRFVGFAAMTGSYDKIDIRGRDGQALAKAWEAGPRTYLGLSTHGFPNLFMITGPGSPSVLAQMIQSIEQHVDWMTDCLCHMRDVGAETFEPTLAAQDAWVEHVNQVAAISLRSTCSSWYVGANIPGRPRVFMPYIGGFPIYVQKCNEVQTHGYEGFTFDGAPLRNEAPEVRETERWRVPLDVDVISPAMLASGQVPVV